MPEENSPIRLTEIFLYPYILFFFQVLIIFALAFFFAVVLYILRKRVFPSYGPIEIILHFFGVFSSLFSTIASLWS